MRRTHQVPAPAVTPRVCSRAMRLLRSVIVGVLAAVFAEVTVITLLIVVPFAVTPSETEAQTSAA